MLLLALLAIATAAGGSVRAEGTVHLYYFPDSLCPACVDIHREVLEPLLAEYGDRVVVEEYDIAKVEDFQFLLRLEEAYAIGVPSIPEVFISGKFFLSFLASL